jgi:hypothetical protein
MLDISGRNIVFTCTNLLIKTEEELFEVLEFKLSSSDYGGSGVN